MSTFNSSALSGKWVLIESEARGIGVPVAIEAVMGFDDTTDDILILAANVDGAGAEAKSTLVYKLDLTSTAFYACEADANDAALARNKSDGEEREAA